MSFGVPSACRVAESGSVAVSSPFDPVLPIDLPSAVTVTPAAGLPLPELVYRVALTANGLPGLAEAGALSTSSLGPEMGSLPEVKYQSIWSPLWTGVRPAPVDEATWLTTRSQ